jgi:hypothetical protein
LETLWSRARERRYNREVTRLYLVGRPGLEPGTYGLKALNNRQELHGVNPIWILSGSFVARRVLELAASKDPAVVEAALTLAAIVLAGDEVRLANKIVEGGTFAVMHAVELAELVLTRSAALGRTGAAEAAE